MLGSAVLDLAIGLAVIYLLLSLVCSGVVEGIAGWFAHRGKMLKATIDRLFVDAQQAVSNPVLTIERFYDSPRIQALHQHVKISWRGRATTISNPRLPSYIEPSLFAEEVTRTLAGDDSTNPRSATPVTRLAAITSQLASHPKTGAGGDPLRQMLYDAARDLDVFDEKEAEAALSRFHGKIEDWFNDTMKRSSGWYRRNVQKLLFAIAVIVTITINADTVTIIQELSTDDELRARVADAAAAQVATSTPARAHDTLAQIRGFNLPMGWPDIAGGFYDRFGHQHGNFVGARLLYGIHKLGGWAITVFAIMLGGPFWYDILCKLVSLRSSKRIPTSGRGGTPAAADSHRRRSRPVRCADARRRAGACDARPCGRRPSRRLLVDARGAARAGRDGGGPGIGRRPRGGAGSRALRRALIQAAADLREDPCP